MKRFVPWLLAAALAPAAAGEPAAPAVRGLRCEARVEPAGIDSPPPRLSWLFDDPRRGARPTAWQVLLAAAPAALARDQGDVWDSGKVPGDACAAVARPVTPLEPGACYWWKVRVWDAGGSATRWSEPARFLTGKPDPTGWRGGWIGPALSRAAGRGAVLGFAVEARDADQSHWIQVDLGEARPLDRIVLHPMRHHDPAAGGWIDGYGFPVRFHIEVADDAAFTRPQRIADFTAADVPNPGTVEQEFNAGRRTARHVRVTATKLWPRGPGLPWVFTLGELEVLSGGANVAAGAPVAASASVEGYGWGKQQLTDGRARCPDPGAATAMLPAHTHGAIYLRKEFELPMPAAHAVLTFSGLGFSEAAIDGRKVGDAVIAPGFTDYDHRVPYLTYEVTSQLTRAGRHRLDVVLADGWYALARDPWVHRLETRPYVDLPKLRLDLHVVHPDGSASWVLSDD